MEKEELVKLLEDVPSPISQIELKLGMPKGTLQKSVKGHRPLSKTWSVKLKHFVETKGYLTVKRKPRKENIIVVENKTKSSNETAKKESDFEKEFQELLKQKNGNKTTK